MRDDILINDIISNIDDFLLDFNYYYTIKNIKRKKRKSR